MLSGDSFSAWRSHFRVKSLLRMPAVPTLVASSGSTNTLTGRAGFSLNRASSSELCARNRLSAGSWVGSVRLPGRLVGFRWIWRFVYAASAPNVKTNSCVPASASSVGPVPGARRSARHRTARAGSVRSRAVPRSSPTARPGAPAIGRDPRQVEEERLHGRDGILADDDAPARVDEVDLALRLADLHLADP